MKEIPIPYVRANQSGIVLLVVLATAFQQPWIVGALLIVQVLGLAFGIRANLFVLLTKPFLRALAAKSQTEAAELLRFNNSIAVIMLTLSSLFFLLNLPIWGSVFALFVALAAAAAICGYCIGCTLYYQFKRLRARRS